MPLDRRGYVLATLYIACAASVAPLVNRIVREPYLDEIFHIPQAQQYCNGQFRGYDPKLTTPPGLYGISLLIGRLWSLLFNVVPGPQRDGLFCNTVEDLRFTSFLALLALPWCIARLAQRDGNDVQGRKGEVQWHHSIAPVSPLEAITRANADPQRAGRAARQAVADRRAQVSARRRRGWTGSVRNTLDDWTAALDAHTIALLPPMWFFGFLYYTDVPSTLLVLLMFTNAQRKRHIVASAFGALSITLRQTNVVWVLFALGTSILDQLSSVGLDTQPLARRSSLTQFGSLVRLPLLDTAKSVFLVVLPYTPIFAASAAFVLYNGSIVLGDREHHQVSTHWVQPFYFAAFAVIFSWPTLFTALRRRGVHSFFNLTSLLSLGLIGTLSFLAIHYGTVTHPFLLADNRHYAFYVWRKVIQRTTWSRYVLAIPYSVSVWFWWIALSERQSVFWLIGFTSCLCAALMPSPLIEPRYFIIPYIVVRSSISPPTSRTSNTMSVSSTHQPAQAQARETVEHQMASLIELVWAGMINAGALFLFLYRPFRWPDSTQWQRFMW